MFPGVRGRVPRLQLIVSKVELKTKTTYELFQHRCIIVSQYEFNKKPLGKVKMYYVFPGHPLVFAVLL